MASPKMRRAVIALLLALIALCNGQRLFLGGSFDSAVQESGALNGVAAYSHSFGYYYYAMGTGLGNRSPPPNGDGPNGDVLASVYYASASELFVGGSFSSISGASNAIGLAKFTVPSSSTADPALGTWTALGTGIDGAVTHLALLSDGNLLVGGNFTSFNGATGSLVRCSRTGTCVSMGAITAPITALAVINDVVYIGGRGLVAASGATVSLVARAASPRGTPVWSGVAIGLCGGDVTSIASLSNGNIYFSGSFSHRGSDCTINSLESRAIIEYNPTTNAFTNTFNYIFSAIDLNNKAIISRLAANGSVLYAAGMFDVEISQNPVQTAFHIAKWDSVRSTWSSLGSQFPSFAENIDSSSDPRFNALAVIDQILYVGGYFAGGVQGFNTGSGIWSDISNGVFCSFCPTFTTPTGSTARAPEVYTFAQLPFNGPTPPVLVNSPIVEEPVDIPSTSRTFEGLGIPINAPYLSPALIEFYENRTGRTGTIKSMLGIDGFSLISWQVWAIVAGVLIAASLILGVVTNLTCRAVARI